MSCPHTDQEGSPPGSDQDSPECLIPVTDPYSSDDGQVHKESRPCFHSVQTYSGSNISALTLKTYFNLVFYTLQSGPKPEDLPSMEAAQILDQLYYFVTKKSDIDTKEIIDDVLRRKKSGVNVLYENKDFQVDLKKDIMNVPMCQEEYDIRCRLACDFLDNAVDMLYLTHKKEVVDSSLHHYTVKSCVDSFLRLLTEKLKGNGVSVLKSADRNVTSEAGVRQKTVSFTARPDLTLTSLVVDKEFPGIPIEIYSPMKINKEVVAKNESGKRKKSKTNQLPAQNCGYDTTTDDEKSDEKNALSQFLSENVPFFMCEKLRSIDNMRLKSKVLTQHILQILAIASDYCHAKKSQGKEMKKSKVFIGLFVCDEFIYVTKIVGDEGRFAKYITGGDVVTRTNKLQKMVELDSLSDSDIHVEFLPMALDITVHSHRLALLLFLDYYMSKWSEIQT